MGSGVFLIIHLRFSSPSWLWPYTQTKRPLTSDCDKRNSDDVRCQIHDVWEFRECGFVPLWPTEVPPFVIANSRRDRDVWSAKKASVFSGFISSLKYLWVGLSFGDFWVLKMLKLTNSQIGFPLNTFLRFGKKRRFFPYYLSINLLSNRSYIYKLYKYGYTNLKTHNFL